MPYTLDNCEIGGRIVYLATGSASQTVNVCTPERVRGRYDWTLRMLSRDFVNFNDLQQFSDVNAMIAWLKNERRAIVESEPDIETTQAPAANSSADTTWIQRAMTITEFCIDELIREFLAPPYLHRVEHSLHTRLYSILRTQPPLVRGSRSRSLTIGKY